MFDIAYTAQAIDDLRLRSNPTADWELRLGDFRILYNVDVQIQIVEIQRVGEKRRNALFFRGRKEDL